jgi:hypothetical protein
MFIKHGYLRIDMIDHLRSRGMFWCAYRPAVAAGFMLDRFTPRS